MVAARAVALVAAFLVALCVARAAGAGQATDQLKGAVDEVLRIIEDPGLKAPARTVERRAAVRKIAQGIFDFQEMARRSLGRHWSGLNDKQRQEFTSLFSDLLERSYVSRIEQYGGERIAYANERVEDDTATVASRIITKRGTEVPVDYRMLRKGSRWLVYDVLIEGVSLVSNYRTQFNKILQTSSYEELIRRLKTKQDEFVVEEQSKDAPAPGKK